MLKKLLKLTAWIIVTPLILFTAWAAYLIYEPTSAGDLTMFECKHIKDHPYPKINPKAVPLFEEANRLRKTYPRTDWNMKKAAKLYEQAIELGHWKAHINLIYLKGTGLVPYKNSDADRLLKPLMEQQVPDAYATMANRR